MNDLELDNALAMAREAIAIPPLAFDEAIFNQKKKPYPWKGLAIAGACAAALVIAVSLTFAFYPATESVPTEIEVNNDAALQGPILRYDGWRLSLSSTGGEKESHEIAIDYRPGIAFLSSGEAFSRPEQSLVLSIERTITMDGPEQYHHTILSKETVYQEESTLEEIYGNGRDWANYAAETLPIIDEVASTSLEGTGDLTYSLVITGKDGAPIDFMGTYTEGDGATVERYLLGASEPLSSISESVSFRYQSDGKMSSLQSSNPPEDVIY